MNGTKEEMAHQGLLESQEATRTVPKVASLKHPEPYFTVPATENVAEPAVATIKPAAVATETVATNVATAESRDKRLDAHVRGSTAPATFTDSKGPSIDLLASSSSSGGFSSNNNSSNASTEQPESTVAEGSSTRNSTRPNSSSNDSTNSNNTDHTSSKTDGSSKESIGFGVPCGEESMKSLRRHVELLMDREMNTKTRSRLETCLDALEPEKLDPQLLRVICAKGLPEGCPALRSLYWRILLHCLPLSASEWQQHRTRLRAAYESYKAEFIREPEAVRRLRRMQQSQQAGGGGDASPAQPKESNESMDVPAADASLPAEETGGTKKSLVSSISLSAVNDHPLSRSATSEWRGYWVDAEVFDQINKDVFRTRPELCFFALNPQQTIARQQQLHLYPPPPTRQPQAALQPVDDVPLLVDYDTLLQRQKQRCDESAPRSNSKPSTRSSKGSAGAINDADVSSKAPASSRKGFRLPAAFRSKKASSSPAAPARNSNEDACNSTRSRRSNYIRSEETPVYSSSRSSLGAADRDNGSHKGRHDGYSGRSSERLMENASIKKSVSNWIDDVQRRAVLASSRHPADAADALEASAAAAEAARQYKRQLSSMKLHEENKAAHRSAPDLRLSSLDSTVSERAAPPSDANRGDLTAGRVSKTSPSGAAAAATLGSASPDATAPSCTLPDPQLSSHPDESPAALGISSQGDDGVSAFEPKETKEGEQQPWRAPAGVQDVCNMLNPRRHYDVLSRLLFIYAKVNPGLCYVQGMNEILAPIYYSLMTDPTYTDYEQAEAEVFYCFSEVMQQQRDAFCKALDPTDAGVRGRLSRLDELLRHKDEEIWMHLSAMGVEPQFYALRWLLLMLTQEFELPDVLALWDGFIADSGRPLPLLYYVCVSMIIWLKPALLAGDFTACMKLLQHLPSFDPKALISSAMRLRADDLLGTCSPAWRAPLPTGFGEGRLGDGLKELDPLQLSDFQQIKSFPRSTAPCSGPGGTSTTVRTSHPQSRLHGATIGNDRLDASGTAASPTTKGSAPRSNADGSDAALEHLKRLAGVGVEHAYKGASVVSQYLNNSGLAAGLASNITSFFSSDSQSSNLGSPVYSPAPATADRIRQPTALNKRGNHSSLSPPSTLVTTPRAAEYDMPAATIARPLAQEAKQPVPSLEECLFSPEPLQNPETDSTLITDCSVKDESPRPGKPGEAGAPSFQVEEQGVLVDLLDTPRSVETPPFNSPAGEGLRITIL